MVSIAFISVSNKFSILIVSLTPIDISSYTSIGIASKTLVGIGTMTSILISTSICSICIADGLSLIFTEALGFILILNIVFISYTRYPLVTIVAIFLDGGVITLFPITVFNCKAVIVVITARSAVPGGLSDLEFIGRIPPSALPSVHQPGKLFSVQTSSTDEVDICHWTMVSLTVFITKPARSS